MNISRARMGRLAFVLLFAAVAFFHLSRINGTWVITPDSTDYVEGAFSIAQGKGYVDFTEDPVTLFPPGTSLAYLAAAALPRSDYLYFNLSTKLMLLGYLALSYLFLEKALGWMPALLGFLVLSFSMVPIHESTRILSDIPFAFLVLFIFYIFDPKRLETASLLQAVLLGFLITLSYFVRTEGLYIFCGYFLYVFLAVKKNRKKLLIAISCFFVAGVLLWSIHNARYDSGSSYMVLLEKNPWVSDSGIASIADWSARVSHNAIRLATAVGRAFSNRYDSFWLGLSLCGFAAVTLLERERYAFFCLAFFVFFIPIHLTPVNFQDRYLISILPLLALLLLKGFRRFVQLFSRKTVRMLTAVALVLTFVLSSYWVAGYRFATMLNKRAKRVVAPPILYAANEEFQKLAAGYNPYLKRDDVIATFHPNILRYLTPKSVTLTNFVLSENVERSYTDLRGKGVTYLYVDLKTYRAPHMLAVLERHQSQFLLISSNEGAAIYKTQFFNP